MEIIPIFFKFKRENTVLPILTVVGVSSKYMPGIKEIMLGEAVSMIRLASKFNGRVMKLKANEEIDIEENEIAIKFYLAFRTEADLYRTVWAFGMG